MVSIITKGINYDCFRKSCLVALLISICMTLTACGPSTTEIESLVDERLQVLLAEIPTVTPIPSITPSPTTTPQPTPTVVTFLPTPTPITILPTPTPITIMTIPTATPQPIVNFNKVYSDISASVFKITAGNGHGTGWIIENGLIVTNEHVIRGHATVIVHQVSNDPFTAIVIGTDSKRDIALLAYDESVTLDPTANPLSLGTATNADLAQPLMALGYSGQAPVTNGFVDMPSANVGVLSLIIDLGANSRGFTLVMDVPVDPGDSGGPVVNSTGEVVGMTTGVVESSKAGQRVVGTFYALHIDEIKSSSKDEKNKRRWN